MNECAMLGFALWPHGLAILADWTGYAKPWMVKERVFEQVESKTASEQIFEIQERVSGDFDEDSSDAFAEIGSRLLSLTFTRSKHSGKHYASDPAQADHGIALLNEGACLNLKWNF